ncbi:alpha/beta hydrolase [Acidocella aquatica]|uniref:Alpha/beta hydrolase n=1 Tax=Acidocella aquatica TaxID=1922313 RepID=A0ABQ6A3H6_9PROT|nr:alpha/beta fold hydrolase [Acidocella aquatica]GLR66724.1 alpha/beta hydrolase [Acidocella aquatica]
MKLEIAHLPAEGARRGCVVFLHGAWCWNWYWKPYFLPYFASRGYDSTAFSLRGHGGSEGRAQLNAFSIADYVRDLRAVVETLENPLIVGHSMGGFITQAYLTQHTARGAVLLASTPPKTAFTPLLKTLLTGLTSPATGDLGMLRRQMFSRGPDDRSMDAYLHNIQAESLRAAGSIMLRGIKHPERIKTPLLVIGAGQDHLVPPPAVALTARTYRTQPVMFDEMSHMLMLEPRWQDVADTIIGFETSLAKG